MPEPALMRPPEPVIPLPIETAKPFVLTVELAEVVLMASVDPRVCAAVALNVPPWNTSLPVPAQVPWLLLTVPATFNAPSAAIVMVLAVPFRLRIPPLLTFSALLPPVAPIARPVPVP